MAIDISNLSDEDKRKMIKSHIYNINSMNSMAPMSSNSIMGVKEEIMDILVSMVTELVDTPQSIDLKPNKTNVVRTYFAYDVADFENCVTLFTVDEQGRIRCYKNETPSYKHIMEQRGRKIDGLIDDK
jgi:hypothetical protein